MTGQLLFILAAGAGLAWLSWRSPAEPDATPPRVEKPSGSTDEAWQDILGRLRD